MSIGSIADAVVSCRVVLLLRIEHVVELLAAEALTFQRLEALASPDLARLGAWLPLGEICQLPPTTADLGARY